MVNLRMAPRRRDRRSRRARAGQAASLVSSLIGAAIACPAFAQPSPAPPSPAPLSPAPPSPAPPSPAPPSPAPPSPAPPSPAPIEATLIIGAPSELSAMAERLTGHRVRLGDHVLLLQDIAGMGAPWVGRIALRCGQLWLHTAVRTFRLSGPLARPRLAGPGYLMWVVGHRRRDARRAPEELEVLRLGVLSPPADRAAALEEAGAPCPTPAPEPLP
ncbi:MAG: hypothetical protein R3B48_00010 [Kofleriaceae bacterium]